mmetsp:Transcript_30740/g.35269  ORF Transcript_30740/g.35269 Transcript_30740/m.35269 type:complete len:726 (+) Transcript_30740:112-2289(+)
MLNFEVETTPTPTSESSVEDREKVEDETMAATTGAGTDTPVGVSVQIIQEPILSAISKYAVVVPHPHRDGTDTALKISPGVISPYLPSWTMEDIESELTVLVSLVPGCVYIFEKQQNSQMQSQMPVCVLYLPTDYASYVRSRRIKNTIWSVVSSLFRGTVAVLRLLVAAGIVISIALLALFVVAFIIALIVAASSQQNNGGQRRMHGGSGGGLNQVLGLLRTAMWYNYLFGDNYNNGMYFGGPMIFMNPFGYGGGGGSSYLYWMMLRNMLRRNPRRNNANVNDDSEPPPPSPQRRQLLSNMLSVLDSSSNINDNNSDNNSNIQQQPNHNVLAVVDEFLFGPSKAELKTLGGPSIQDVWRLRAAVVTSTQQKMGQQEQRSRRGVLHPAQLLPYVDNPPPVPIKLLPPAVETEEAGEIIAGELDLSCLDREVDLSEALKIVVHFRGTPDHDTMGKDSANDSGCYYSFQELMGGIDRVAEGTTGCAETGMSNEKNNNRLQQRYSKSSLLIAEGGGDDTDDEEETGPLLQTEISDTPTNTNMNTNTNTNTNINLPILNVLCGYSSPSAPSIPIEWRPGVLHDILFRRSISTINTNTNTESKTLPETDLLPPYLKIGPTVFTNLSPSLLLVCATVAIINILAVHWMEFYGLAPTGPMQVKQWPPAVARVVLGVAWTMRWYSFFFVAVPLVRLLSVVLYNHCIVRPREARRREWAEVVQSSRPAIRSELLE